jgi:hypothetical protein
MHRYTIFFIIVNAIHVSGSFSAHHQELENGILHLYFSLHIYVFGLLEHYHQQAVQNYKKEIIYMKVMGEISAL